MHPEVFSMSGSVPTARWSSLGCYGLRVRGLDAAAGLMVPAAPGWPELTVERATPAGDGPDRDLVGEQKAALPLAGGGWMELVPDRVTFRVAEPRSDGDLLHPYLAPAAALVARWAGHECFHAGAIVAGGGAWGVLGGKEDGKSTLLAWLALRGHAVLSDDLLVIDGDAAMAGPRCIDLREEAAGRLGAGEPLGVVGVRERWRVRLDAVPSSVPLRGWVLLGWAPEARLEPVRGPERLLALTPHRSVRIAPPDPAALLALSSLPIVRFSRPRRWESFAAGADRLLEALAA